LIGFWRGRWHPALHLLGISDHLAQRLAVMVLASRSMRSHELRHQLRHTAGMMEVFHVVPPDGSGRSTPEPRGRACQRLEIDAVLGAVGDRGEMNEAIGRPADRLQYTCAFLNDEAVRNSLGRGPFAFAIAAATLPLASAERNRSHAAPES